MNHRRKSLWIELSIVFVVIVFLCWMTIPSFLNTQEVGKARNLEEGLQFVFQQMVDDPYPTQLASQVSSSYHVGFTGPIYKRDSGYLYLDTKTQSYAIDYQKLRKKFESLELPDREPHQLAIAVHFVYGNASPEVVEIGKGYRDKPFYSCLFAKVGEQLEVTRLVEPVQVDPFRFDVGADGNYKIDTFYTPYDPSNGVKSEGEFLFDTRELWPKQKAVIVNGPDPNLGMPKFK